MCVYVCGFVCVQSKTGIASDVVRCVCVCLCVCVRVSACVCVCSFVCVQSQTGIAMGWLRSVGSLKS